MRIRCAALQLRSRIPGVPTAPAYVGPAGGRAVISDDNGNHDGALTNGQRSADRVLGKPGHPGRRYDGHSGARLGAYQGCCPGRAAPGLLAAGCRARAGRDRRARSTASALPWLVRALSGRGGRRDRRVGGPAAGRRGRPGRGIAALRQDRRSRLRVSASSTIAEQLLPEWLASFLAGAPPERPE